MKNTFSMLQRSNEPIIQYKIAELINHRTKNRITQRKVNGRHCLIDLKFSSTLQTVKQRATDPTDIHDTHRYV